MSILSKINARGAAPFSSEEAMSMEAHLLIGGRKIHFAAVSVASDGQLFVTSVEANQLDCGVEQMFWDLPILSLPYRCTHITVEDGGAFVLVPHDLRECASAEEWLDLAVDRVGRKVLTTQLEEQRMELIYTMSDEFFGFCQRSFSIPHYCHEVVPFVKLAVRQTRRELLKVVSLQHFGDCIYIVVASEGEIVFANRYKVVGDTDVLYYITALYRRHKFDPSEVPVHIYGDMDLRMLKELLEEVVTDVKVNYYPYLTERYHSLREVAEMHPYLVLQMLCE